MRVTLASASRMLVRRPEATLPPPMMRTGLPRICQASINDPPGRMGGYLSVAPIESGTSKVEFLMRTMTIVIGQDFWAIRSNAADSLGSKFPPWGSQVKLNK